MITTTTKGKGYRDNVCGGDKKKHVLRASRAEREREMPLLQEEKDLDKRAKQEIHLIFFPLLENPNASLRCLLVRKYFDISGVYICGTKVMCVCERESFFIFIFLGITTNHWISRLIACQVGFIFCLSHASSRSGCVRRFIPLNSTPWACVRKLPQKNLDSFFFFFFLSILIAQMHVQIFVYA